MQRFKNGLMLAPHYLQRCLPVLIAVAMIAFGSGNLFAQEEGDAIAVKDIISQDDWENLIEGIVSAVTAVMKIILGIAVGYWLVGLLYRAIKKYAKG